jgi:murein DD-endopeptidase MepM/ murein hydrolase activator NlpD
MQIKKLSLLLLVSISFLLYTPALSMPMNAGSGPSYLVQPGDSLSSIASRFGLTLQELMDANPTIDPNTLAIGDQVLIPGLEGIEGLLITDSVQFGDSLTSLSRRNQIQPEYLIKLNHITSPSELFAGLGVVLPQKENFKPLSNRLAFPSDSSLLEAAVLNETTVYDILSINQLGGSWQALPSDVLYDDKVNEDNPQSALPFSLEKLIISPLPMTQGGTVKIFVQPKGDAAISGMLVDKPLHFFPDGTGQLVAIQGVHAMLNTGPYPLRIVSTRSDGTIEAFEQMVIVQSGNYPADPILNVDPATIDPAATEPEIELINGLVSKITDQKLWSGLFLSPSYFNDCFTSRYGNRRTYVGIGTDRSFDSFHSGLDFCGGTGLPITAPADGVIVFSGPLTVRGNATIIDHGWGIFSGIWHQDSTVVTTGQTVKQGELIGYVGGTGRVTGAHLHWEIWANGVQVNPMEWLENQYP